jgi:hypothetical protein
VSTTIRPYSVNLTGYGVSEEKTRPYLLCLNAFKWGKVYPFRPRSEVMKRAGAR